MIDRKIFIIIIAIISCYLAYMNYDYLKHYFNTYSFYLFLGILFNIILYRYYIKFKIFENFTKDTISMIASFIEPLFLIIVLSEIGGKKSANTTAMAQICEMLKISKMLNRYNRIKYRISKYIDVEKLSEYFYSVFDSSKVYIDDDYEKLVKVFNKDNDNIDLNIEEKLDPFKYTIRLNIIAEFLELTYYIYIRNNHIQSNYAIESINTGNLSLPLNEELMQMYRENDVAYEKYLTLVKDEEGIVDNSRVYARMDTASRIENDDGTDVFSLANRHGSKSTNTIFLVSQNTEEIAANRRRLGNQYIEIFRNKEILIYDLEINLIEKLINRLSHDEESKKIRYDKSISKLEYKINNCLNEKKLKKLKSKYLKVTRKYNKFSKDNNYRKLIRSLDVFQVKLKKYTYLVSPILLHKSHKDVGKSIKNENNRSLYMSFVYNAEITYGRYDTHSFYGIFVERNKKAKISLAMVEPFKGLIMTKEEHLRMNYRAITKIYDKINRIDTDQEF